MAVLAFTAYAAWICLVAALFRKACLPCGGKAGSGPKEFGPKEFGPKESERAARSLRGVIASCFGVGAFFFVPPGSLPPFCNVAWGGCLFLGCLLIAALAAKDRDGVIALLPISGIAFVMFWYAYRRGMPGSAANLGTFVGMPVWGIAPPWQICGFLLLAAVFLLSARMRIPVAGASCSAILRHLAVCALFVPLFAPWNTAPYFDWPDALVAGCDFVLFWGKVLVLAVLLRRR